MYKAANVFAKTVSIIIGLMFLIGGSIFFFCYDPADYDMQTTGTIVEITDYYDYTGQDDPQLMHDVYIDYTVDGVTYEHAEYFEYNSKMKVGDTVELYYMSQDPTQIAGSDKNMAPYFGLGIALIGLIMLIVNIIKIIRRKPM